MSKAILCVGDVAARYQVNRTTVLRWFERGVLSYYCLHKGKGGRRTIWLYPEQLTAFETLHLVLSKHGNAPGAALFDPHLVLSRPCDLARDYGVHLTTVLRWCENGLISHYNLTLLTGGKRTVRFHPSHVEAFENAALVPVQEVMRAARPAARHHS